MPAIIKRVQGHLRGYETLSGPDGVVENEAFTCAHRQEIVTVPHGSGIDGVGSICKRCMEPICRACTLRGDCEHFEIMLARMEAVTPGLVAFACQHCRAAVRFGPNDDPDLHAGICSACASPICRACTDRDACPRFLVTHA